MAIANCGGLKIDGETLYEEDGVLKAQGGGSSLFIVDFTVDIEAGTVTANKTPTEVETAMWTQPVLGRITMEGISFPLTLAKAQGGNFSLVFVVSGAALTEAEWYIIQIKSTNTWTLYQA